MAAAIERLLADPERTAQLGRTARKRIQSVFQWRDTAQSLVGVFEETLRAAPRRPRVA
jgi:glycosyltransferase involved in cell wall biosynthesis